MSAAKMSSRTRMLAALDRGEVDHPPCSFMLYNGLKSSCRDYAQFIELQVAMGLDTVVQVPPRPPVVKSDSFNLHGLPVRHDPRVVIHESITCEAGETWPIMTKEYRTPAGALRAEVRQTDDWPYGDHVPFLDDYIEPRSRKFLVEEEGDLEALRYLLVPPGAEEIATFRAEAAVAKALARKHDLLVAAGWGVGADLIGWIGGLERMMIMAYDRPAMLRELLQIIASWNLLRQEAMLEAGVDLFIKRAWYENCDFWTPESWRSFLFPLLKTDVDRAHERGVRFGYLVTAHCMPLLPMLVELGVDVVIGVDPGAWDLGETARVLGGKVSTWGGVSGHQAVERGTPGDVRAEVRQAMEVLGAAGGFVLSPVDNVRTDTPAVRANVAALIDEWRRG